ncbi:MAG: hypothetical protein QG646_3184 [Euryarchaeota archaeon]|nr:hypothetical protein [Euryarchaeota archaeon]
MIAGKLASRLLSENPLNFYSYLAEENHDLSLRLNRMGVSSQEVAFFHFNEKIR